MNFIIFFIIFQAEISVYDYYSKKLCIRPEEILNKKLRTELNVGNSFYFDVKKNFPFLFFNTNYYFLNNFSQIKGEIFVFKNMKTDTILLIRNFIRGNFPAFKSLTEFKISPFFYYGYFLFHFNYLNYLYYSENLNEYHYDFSGEIYIDRIKTGFGFLKDIQKEKIYPCFFLSPDFKKILYPTLFLYFKKNKFFPGLKIYFIKSGFIIYFDYFKNFKFFSPYKECFDILSVYPFDFKGTNFHIFSNSVSFKFYYIFKVFSLFYEYKKFWGEEFLMYYFKDNSFECEKFPFIEEISFNAEIFKRFTLRFKKINSGLELLTLDINMGFKGIFFNPEIFYLIKNNFVVFGSKIGYIYNDYRFFIYFKMPNKIINPIKKEVRFGIQKRF